MQQSISQSLCDGIAKRYWKKLDNKLQRPARLIGGEPQRITPKYKYLVKQQSHLADLVFSIELSKHMQIASFARSAPHGRVELMMVARDKKTAGVSGVCDFAISKHALARAMYRTKQLDPRLMCEAFFMTWHYSTITLLREKLVDGKKWDYARDEKGQYVLPINTSGIRGMMVVGTSDPLHKNLALTFVAEDQLRRDQIHYLSNMDIVSYRHLSKLDYV